MPPTRTLYVDNIVDKVIEKLLYVLFLQAGPVEFCEGRISSPGTTVYPTQPLFSLHLGFSKTNGGKKQFFKKY